MSQSLRVLIADDNRTDRMILEKIVRNEGHDVVSAANGHEAVFQYHQAHPDLILLDVLMPVLDGVSAAQQIRKSSTNNEYVPIIFLTSLRDAESLAECLASGGDDFLSKPYNQVILKAKINAFGRMRMMHNTLQAHNRQMLIEQQVAKTIFDNVAHSGCLDSENIQYSLSPMSVFNGDTVLAQRRPDGGMFLFLGDFTGHGLPAAIGAMPLAEIFYGMTSKGFAMEEVLREMNSKLNDILPVGIFCCGCFVELDFYDKTATIWLGGLPDIVCVRHDLQPFDTVSAQNLPLGVLEPSRFNPVYTELMMADEDELYIWSDGIIEARNPEDEIFGEERLYSCLVESEQSSKFEKILKTVEDFIGQADAADDLTLLSVKMVNIEQIGLPDYVNKRGSLGGPQDWEFCYSLNNTSLSHFNPLPIILTIVTEVEGLRSMSGQLYTLMTELYSNALEHGVLGLQSSLKSTPDGFASYYVERQQRLEKLEQGQIKIWIKHIPLGSGGRLAITLSDSGSGFDHEKIRKAKRNRKGYSGRGLPLVDSICDEFYYNEAGNSVSAFLRWPESKKGKR